MTRFEIDYTIDDMRAFFEATAKKNLIKNLIITYGVIGIVIFAIFLIARSFLNISDFMPIIFLGIYIVLVVPAIVKSVGNAPEKIFSQFSQSYDGNAIICQFEKDCFYVGDVPVKADNEVISSYDVSLDENRIFYSDIEKVIETDNYFYIFVNAQTAQIVRKSAVTEGSVDEIREALKIVLNEKYTQTTKYR